ncbi:MAG TPA: alternative ribosome rescue aminoacyl-tRNA hydrolase ArfB [Sphingobacteriaceae bacterium]
MKEFSETNLAAEVEFKATRSGGKGGQHVNKVSSRVELKFDIPGSQLFTEDQKALLLTKLAHRINADNTIRVVSDEERSQLMNKERALHKLYSILRKGLYQEKVRKATKPKKSSIERRLKQKQLQAEKKINRRRDFFS